MLLDYVIIKLSESRTTKGGLTYYVITEGKGGVSEMLNYLLCIIICNA